ncbi:MAG: aspartate/glutamate racemase family protein [Oceanospirillaceae bacterium]|nr:aspartate/glutamate racemase family protein [Oceanospirillaceae bacterium]
MSFETFKLGVIMLNTNFPRVLGDIGNPETFDYPVIYKRVSSAKVSAVVSSDGISQSVKNDIFSTISELEEEGADLIVTSCGFLGEIQKELQSVSNIPVITSSLLLIPFVRTLISDDDKIGVLTFDKASLKEKHFGGYFSNDIVINDIPKTGELYQVIKNDHLVLDTEKAKSEVVAVALDLIHNNEKIKAIILECTNLPPYIDAIREATGLPVFDITQAIAWFEKSKKIMK